MSNFHFNPGNIRSYLSVNILPFPYFHFYILHTVPITKWKLPTKYRTKLMRHTHDRTYSHVGMELEYSRKSCHAWGAEDYKKGYPKGVVVKVEYFFVMTFWISGLFKSFCEFFLKRKMSNVSSNC